jgi:hypothetical protein
MAVDACVMGSLARDMFYVAPSTKIFTNISPNFLDQI